MPVRDSTFVLVVFVKSWVAHGFECRSYICGQEARLRCWLALRLFSRGIVHPV